MKLSFESMHECFPNNKYKHWYINLIEKANLRRGGDIPTPSEKHHVFPVSIFGKNNIVVKLSLREHFIAHLLLTNIYKNDPKNLKINKINYQKMSKAVICLMDTDKLKNRTRLTSKEFECTRTVMHLNQKRFWKEYWSNDENRKAASIKRKRFLKNSINKNKLIQINRKITSNPEFKAKRSQSQKEFFRNLSKEEKIRRIKLLNSSEAKEKARIKRKETIERMTPEERKEKFKNNFTQERKDKQRNQIKDRLALFKGTEKRMLDVKDTRELINLIKIGWIPLFIKYLNLIQAVESKKYSQREAAIKAQMSHSAFNKLYNKYISIYKNKYKGIECQLEIIS